ncbi:hypothetical protein OIDMADRAFT_27624 [Oidiodendron maius Zn]|uniref:Uncharacterized protein n=1 Tax=Oidiodendron maius (strain Zn) TaxID=913774 RepID=A0A0C3CW23_OIDMZ|nr:hypothetical protein OIDMADRAFT_27624 [Oidiodendron maius Zn]
MCLRQILATLAGTGDNQALDNCNSSENTIGVDIDTPAVTASPSTENNEPSLITRTHGEDLSSDSKGSTNLKRGSNSEGGSNSKGGSKNGDETSSGKESKEDKAEKEKKLRYKREQSKLRRIIRGGTKPPRLKGMCIKYMTPTTWTASTTKCLRVRFCDSCKV